MDRTPYAAVLRLFAVAEERWAEIEASYYQIDLMKISERKLLNLIAAWCLERVPPKDRDKWEYELTKPLPGVEEDEERLAEEEGQLFMQAMGAMNAVR